MDTVYIEMSIVSYATARPSRDIQIVALQQQARDWWSVERPKFDLVNSQLTLDEAPLEMVRRHREAQNAKRPPHCWTSILTSMALAALLLASHMMPQKAAADALHVAIAALGRCKVPVNLELQAYCECS